MTKNQKHQIKSASLDISTPLGDLFFNFELSDISPQNIKPSKIEVTNHQTTIFSWYFDNFILEFLKLNFTPKLPMGMKVDNCICGIWRIKALRDIDQNFTFSCNLKSNFEGFPESGEGLECQSFENENFKLSIGTEDQEYLLRRMELHDWLPHRFQSEQNEIQLEYFPKGIKLTLPNLLQNEKAQVQFVVAWSSKKNQEVSTWYAVDQSANKLLQEVDIT